MLVRAELQAEFPNATLQVSDRNYQIMDGASIRGQAWEMFTWLLTHYRVPRRPDRPDLPEWQHKFQCEDFSVVILSIILLMHWRAAASSAEGVYAGLVFHRTRQGEGHVVLVIRRRGGLMAYEPQANEFYHFTQEEKESSWLVVLF